MVEQAGSVVEPQQQRSYLRPVRQIAEAAHHAIGRTHPLHLAHRTSARLIWTIKPLGDDPVQVRAQPLQPGLGLLDLVGRGREAKVRQRVELAIEHFQRKAAQRQRLIQQAVPVGGHQAIEQDQHGRLLLAELAHPALGGM